jgi:hypothetical protein
MPIAAPARPRFQRRALQCAARFPAGAPLSRCEWADCRRRGKRRFHGIAQLAEGSRASTPAFSWLSTHAPRPRRCWHFGMGSQPFGLSLVRRMNALLHQRPRLVSFLPGIIKRYMPFPLVVEILADGKDVFLASDAIAVAPQLRAGRSHFQIKPAAVGSLIGFSPGLVLRIFASVRGMMRVSGEVIPATIPAIYRIAMDNAGCDRMLIPCYC